MKILVLHGPNLQLLGVREPEIYGRQTLDDINEELRKRAKVLGVSLDFFQSNEEGVLVTRIGESRGKYDGLLINPAAYTHTSVAIYDALRGVGLPAVEVHLSHIARREDFRRQSIVAGACIGQVSGFGAMSYSLALEGLNEYIGRAQRG